LFHVPCTREWNSGTKRHLWNKEWNTHGTKFSKLFIYKGLKAKKVEQGWNKNGTERSKVVPGPLLFHGTKLYLWNEVKHE